MRSSPGSAPTASSATVPRDSDVRIVAGEFRSRRIDAPPGRATRPMLDRVREAVFSSLQPRLADAFVLDLFAGSGSLGLEALSRGARHVRFVERGAPALAALRKNVDALGVRGRVTIVPEDASKPRSWGDAADVAFLDPPYALLEERRSRLIELVAALVRHLVPAGIVVLHTAHGALASAELEGLRARVRRYGTNDLWYVDAVPPA
jgi:16S rRNA (guanine966-N2)-methyltransferase